MKLESLLRKDSPLRISNRRRKYRRVCRPLVEKFNLVSNANRRMQKCDFSVLNYEKTLSGQIWFKKLKLSL